MLQMNKNSSIYLLTKLQSFLFFGMPKINIHYPSLDLIFWTIQVVLLAKSRQIAAPVLPAGDRHLVIQKSKNRVAIAGATFFDRSWVARVGGLVYFVFGKFYFVFYNPLCPTAKGAILRMNLSLNTTPKQETETQKRSTGKLSAITALTRKLSSIVMQTAFNTLQNLSFALMLLQMSVKKLVA